MRKALQKPIALLLALVMTFGAMPFAGIAMFASAADPVLENVMISPQNLTLTELGATYSLELKPIWKNNVPGEFLAKDITWRSSNPEYVTIVGSTTTPTAVITVEKLPAKLDESKDIVITADYLNTQSVSKSATRTVTITRKNDDLNILKSIKFNPDKVTLKTMGETIGLAIEWNWNPDIADADKFPLNPKDLKLESSNTNYVVVEQASPLGAGDLFTEDQAVAYVSVVNLPSNVGESVDVTITATYHNNKSVVKVATAMVTVTHFEDKVVLKKIEILPEKATFTQQGQSLPLTVNPVWLNDVAGDFDSKKVVWSVPLAADAAYITITDKGLVTVLKMPAPGATYNAVVRAEYVYDNEVYRANCDITLQNITPVKTLESISIAPDAVVMKNVGDKQQLYVTALYSEVDSAGVKHYSSMIVTVGVAFNSSDESMIRTSGTGLMEVISTPAPNATKDADITVTAYFGGMTAECQVKIPVRKIYVNRINLDNNVTAVVTDPKIYTFDELFRFTTYLTETPPAGVTVDRSITLSCNPADAATIDNTNRTVLFHAINSEKASATLTLTANNPSPDCKPVSFNVTIYNDVPLQKVMWDYPVGSSTGRVLFSYYDSENVGLREILGHYYETTVGNITTYTYHTVPEYARAICTFKVTSSNERVLRVDEKTKCLIPVGNGETKLTITAKTPKGATRSHTIIVVIQDSPYTPIKDVTIGYEPGSAPDGVSYNKDSDTLSMLYNQSITLVPQLIPEMEGKTPKLDQEEIYFRTLDGRNLTIVETPTYSWSSSDTSVVKIDAKTGKLETVGTGKAVITIKIEDNGVTVTHKLNIKSTMTWWEALIGIIISFITFKWKKIPTYFKALIEAILVNLP